VAPGELSRRTFVAASAALGLLVLPREDYLREKLVRYRPSVGDPCPREEREAGIGAPVYETRQLVEVFKVLSFAAPSCVARRRLDGVVGTTSSRIVRGTISVSKRIGVRGANDA
jgi:hypothetical protein